MFLIEGSALGTCHLAGTPGTTISNNCTYIVQQNINKEKFVLEFFVFSYIFIVFLHVINKIVNM